MKRSARPPFALDLLFLILSLFAFGINLFLLVRRFSDAAASIAGCGGGDCEEVLASRWSAIFGVPVTVFGLCVYAVLMVSLTERGRRLREPLLGMIAGAALWFVFAQFVLIGKICPWCMAAHGVGMVLVGLGMVRCGFARAVKGVGFWSAVSFLGIGLAQVYGPLPTTHRIDELPAAPVPKVPVPASAGRKAVFDGGRKTYDIASLPRLGPVAAKLVMVEYFDYQCAACRRMSGFLEVLLARHPQDLAVLLLPVPLDGACNHQVSVANQHPGSCETARIALAVWRVCPEAFPSFHRELMADPSLENSRRLALERMSPERLAAALADPWIASLIRSNIADWHEFSKSTDKLPKLLIRDRRILHGLPSGEADFIRVMEQELGL